MSRPLVSIVTPCLNPGFRLLRCIESIRTQTYDRIEHIVVDGGSTDGSVELLSSLNDVRWISEADSGQTEAINKGFSMASGDFVGWLNADDVLTRHAVTSVVRAFEEDSSIGWTIGDVVVVVGDIATKESPAKVGKPFTWMARNLASQPGSFVARWALDAVGPLDVTMHYMMDLDLWLRLVDEGIKHAYVRDVLAVFEVHGESKSGSLSHSVFLLDDCMARMKSGRYDQAAFSLGRSLAWKDELDGNPLAMLRAELGRLDPEGTTLREDVSRHGFLVEWAILDVKSRRLKGLRLLDPHLWARPEARSRLWDLLRRAASQGVRRRAGAKYKSLLA